MHTDHIKYYSQYLTLSVHIIVQYINIHIYIYLVDMISTSHSNNNNTIINK